MYNPIVGRWMEEDPINFKAGTTNLSGYVSNDATNATDVSGLEWQFGNRTKYADLNSGQLEELYKQGKITDVEIGSQTDSAGNVFSYRFNGKRGQFYGQFQFKDEKNPIEIAKCIPPNAINIQLWKYDQRGVFAEITWYNIGLPSGEDYRKAFNDALRPQWLDVLKSGYDAQVRRLDWFIAGNGETPGKLYRHVLTTAGQKKSVNDLFLGNKTGVVRLPIRKYTFDVTHRKLTTKQYTVRIQRAYWNPWYLGDIPAPVGDATFGWETVSYP
jgi:hypothetical protein